MNDRRTPDEIVDIILESLPEELTSGSVGDQVRNLATKLAESIVAVLDGFDRTNEYDEVLLKQMNLDADALQSLDQDFSLSDIDQTWDSRKAAYCFNTYNLFARMRGHADHESHWDGESWQNWNDVVRCFPKHFHLVEPPGSDWTSDAVYAPVQRLVQNAKSIRVVAGGHCFNTSASTGGQQAKPAGELLCLDKYCHWSKVSNEIARKQFGSTGQLLRVQAGIRLRDLNEAMWETGLALPMCGSTDTQSLGGLIATDLHGSGRHNGFLSEQIHELKLVRADGELVTWRRKNGGWTTDESVALAFDTLPPSGALGLLGVVVEVVVELVPAFFFGKALLLRQS